MTAGDRYKVVARTYVQRWLFIFSVVVSAIYLSAAFRALATEGPQGAEAMVAILLSLGGWALCAGPHLKQQIANANARTMPGYVRPHLVVAGAVATVCIAMHAVVESIVLSHPWPTAAGMMAVVFTFVLSAAYRQATWWVLAGVMLVCCAVVPPVGRSLMAALQRGHPITAIVLWATAAAILVLLIRRCLIEHEELPGYHRQPKYVGNDQRSVILRQRRMATNWSKHSVMMINQISAGLDKLPRHIFNASRWTRIRYWEHSFPMRIAPWYIGLGVFTLSAIILLIWPDMGGAVLFTAVRSTPWVALVGTGASQISNMPRLSWDVMRPVTRRQMIDEMGGAAMLIIAKSCVALWVGSLVAWAILAEKHDPLGPPVIGLSLLLVAAGTIGILGVGFYFASFRSRWVQGGAMFVFILAPAYGLMRLHMWLMWGDLRSLVTPSTTVIDPNLPLYCAAPMFAVAGIALLIAARRRWARIEMG